MRRRAGIDPRPRFGPIDKILTYLVAMVALSSCAPAATSVLNASLGDEAELVFVVDDTSPCGDVTTTGLCFAPGADPALGVQLDVTAETVASIDEACQAETYGATCSLGNVDEPTFVAITAEHVTATAAYRRAGSNRLYQEAARF